MSDSKVSMIDEALITDIFLLRSSLRLEEFAWNGTEGDKSRWDRILERYEAGSLVEEQAQVGGDVPGSIDFSLQLLEHPLVRLNVQAPLVRPSQGDDHTKLSISSPDINQSSTVISTSSPEQSSQEQESSPQEWLENLKKELDVRWRESFDEQQENRLFDVYTHLSSWITEHPLGPLVGTAIRDQLDPRKGQQDTTLSGIQMYRQIFYTHHLLSPIKQRELSAWSTELGVWLLVKLGYPGFLILEGPKHGLSDSASGTSSSGSGGAHELSRRIRGMQWAKLNSRTEVEWTLELEQIHLRDQLEKSVLLACPLAKACLIGADGDDGKRAAEESPAVEQWDAFVDSVLLSDKKLRAGIRKTESVKEIVDQLRIADIPEQELVDGLNLRVGSAG